MFKHYTFIIKLFSYYTLNFYLEDFVLLLNMNGLRLFNTFLKKYLIIVSIQTALLEKLKAQEFKTKIKKTKNLNLYNA